MKRDSRTSKGIDKSGGTGSGTTVIELKGRPALLEGSQEGAWVGRID